MERHVVLALIIPVVFLGIAGVVKSLIKSQFTWGNFYLGVDLSLAALANGLINIINTLHEYENISLGHDGQDRILYALCCIFFSIVALFSTMLIHQNFENLVWEPERHKLRRGLLMGVLCNLLGGTALIALIWLKIWRLV
jgi:hypothetical protein